jgi:hypothetical protein
MAIIIIITVVFVVVVIVCGGSGGSEIRSKSVNFVLETTHTHTHTHNAERSWTSGLVSPCLWEVDGNLIPVDDNIYSGTRL